jgi:hypothetical protein
MEKYINYKKPKIKNHKIKNHKKIINCRKVGMKLLYFFIVLVTILLIFMIITQKSKEGFLSDYCGKYISCMECSSASGCSWCPKAKECLTSTTLKSTDKTCNQMNTISSSFRCPSAEGVEPPTLPEAIASNEVLYDFSLYKNRITDKIPPPNTYTTATTKISNEDLLSNMNDVRNSITNYKVEMPSIIVSTIENQIKPMVKGILSENYYIQGFEDYNGSQAYTSLNKCQTHNSCSSCVADTLCGWDPRSNQCGKNVGNNLWQVTQPSRCVLTSTTIKQMTTKPAGNV